MSNIANVVVKHSKKMMKDIQGVWNKYGNDSIVSGKANIKFTITEDKENFVSGEYEASGQKMWILEYGKGNLMDRNNPYLDDYIGGGIYNINRGHFEVRTRRTYTDLDGKTHIGFNDKHFKDTTWLEKGLDTNIFAYHNNGKYKGKKLEFAPLHIIYENLHRDGSQRENDFRQDLLETVKKDINTEIRLIVTKEGGVFI